MLHLRRLALRVRFICRRDLRRHIDDSLGANQADGVSRKVFHE